MQGDFKATVLELDVFSHLRDKTPMVSQLELT